MPRKIKLPQEQPQPPLRQKQVGPLRERQKHRPRKNDIYVKVRNHNFILKFIRVLQSKPSIKFNIFIEIRILISIKMSLNFETIPNWSFTENDQKAKKKLSELRIHSCAELPPEHRSRTINLTQKKSCCYLRS